MNQREVVEQVLKEAIDMKPDGLVLVVKVGNQFHVKIVTDGISGHYMKDVLAMQLNKLLEDQKD